MSCAWSCEALGHDAGVWYQHPFPPRLAGNSKRCRDGGNPRPHPSWRRSFSAGAARPGSPFPVLRAAPAAGRPGLSERGTARPLGRTARGLEGSDSPGHCGQLKFADHPWPSFMPSGYRKRLERCQPGAWSCGRGRRGGAPSVHVAQRLLPADPAGGPPGSRGVNLPCPASCPLPRPA